MDERRLPRSERAEGRPVAVPSYGYAYWVLRCLAAWLSESSSRARLVPASLGLANREWDWARDGACDAPAGEYIAEYGQFVERDSVRRRCRRGGLRQRKVRGLYAIALAKES
jgi:hypothetical protein